MIETYIHEHYDLKSNLNKEFIWRKPAVIIENGKIISPEIYDLEGLPFLDWLKKYPTKLHWEKPFINKKGDVIKHRRPYYNSTWKIFKTKLNPGETFYIYEKEKTDEFFRSKEQLELLLEDLNAVFRHITPHDDNLQTFSSANRNIILIACMEVELHLRTILINNGYKLPKGKKYTTTRDFIHLLKFIELKANISIIGYENLSPLNPFMNWNDNESTKSIKWYDAYNKIKHDRQGNMNLATFENVLLAMSALVLLLKIRFVSNDFKDTNCIFSNISNFKFSITIDNSWYDRNIEQVINSSFEGSDRTKVKYFERFPIL